MSLDDTKRKEYKSSLLQHTPNQHNPYGSSSQDHPNSRISVAHHQQPSTLGSILFQCGKYICYTAIPLFIFLLLLYLLQDIMIYPRSSYNQYDAAFIRQHLIPTNQSQSSIRLPTYTIIPIGYSRQASQTHNDHDLVQSSSPFGYLLNSTLENDPIWEQYDIDIVLQNMASEGKVLPDVLPLSHESVLWYIPPFVDSISAANGGNTTSRTTIETSHPSPAAISCDLPDSIAVMSGGNAMRALDWIAYIDKDHIHLSHMHSPSLSRAPSHPVYLDDIHNFGFTAPPSDHHQSTTQGSSQKQTHIPHRPPRVGYLLVDLPGYGLNQGSPTPLTIRNNMQTALTVLSRLLSTVHTQCHHPTASSPSPFPIVPLSFVGFSLGCSTTLFGVHDILHAHAKEALMNNHRGSMTNHTHPGHHHEQHSFGVLPSPHPLFVPSMSSRSLLMFSISSVVLVAPFSSLQSLIYHIFRIPSMITNLLLRHHFDNQDLFTRIIYLNTIHVTLSHGYRHQQRTPPSYHIIHSLDDDIIPASEGIRLYDHVCNVMHAMSGDHNIHGYHHQQQQQERTIFSTMHHHRDQTIGWTPLHTLRNITSHHHQRLVNFVMDTLPFSSHPMMVYPGDALSFARHLFPHQSYLRRVTSGVPLEMLVVRNNTHLTSLQLSLLHASTHNTYFTFQYGNIAQYYTFIKSYTYG